jgi:hypothetical protein
MLRFVLAQIPWDAISNLDLQQSYKALRDHLVLVSTTTLTNICRSEDALTVGAINKQLLSRNEVSLALDGWTSTKNVAIMSVIAYYLHQTLELGEVQLALDEADRLFFPVLKAN